MENSLSNRFTQIDILFRKCSDRVLNYIKSRIPILEDAENLSQDVWMRILENDNTLNLDTAVSYIFRIATNLVNDYLRNLYVRKGAHEELGKTQSTVSSLNPEEDLYVKQLSQLESGKIECLPKQRRIIYVMSRFEDKSVSDIADSLSLSFRTVENHLRMGRRDVREYMSAIA